MVGVFGELPFNCMVFAVYAPYRQNLHHGWLHSHSNYHIYPDSNSLLLMCNREIMVGHQYFGELAKPLPSLPNVILRQPLFRKDLANMI